MVMDWLRHRARHPELMDQPGLDVELHRQALRGLHRVNRISRTAGSIWPTIAKFAAKCDRPIRILDVASGGGDTTIDLWRFAKRDGVSVQIDGCDISDVALEYAKSQAEKHAANVRFFHVDVLAGGLPEGYDVVCSSLFFHHLDDDDVVRLLIAMRERSRLVVVSDLLRSRWGYLVCWIGIRLLTRSRICHVDGPLSVQGAFTMKELRGLADRAGMRGITLRQRWPQRCLMTWERE